MPTPINMIFKNLCVDVSIKQQTHYAIPVRSKSIELQICANAKFSWCCAMSVFVLYQKLTAQSSPITSPMHRNWHLCSGLSVRFGLTADAQVGHYRTKRWQAMQRRCRWAPLLRLAPIASMPQAWGQFKGSRLKAQAP